MKLGSFKEFEALNSNELKGIEGGFFDLLYFLRSQLTFIYMIEDLNLQKALRKDIIKNKI